MPNRLLALLLLPLIAVLAAGCGAEAERASSTTDVNALLQDTYANQGKMRSATVDLNLRVNPQGSATAMGPVTAHLSGPFVSSGAGRLPRFQLSATLQAGPKTMQAGASWTGEKAFITLNNTPYAVSDLVARQFAAGYEQALKSNQGSSRGGAALLSGIDFTKWMRDARNEGNAKVGDTDTIKITGQADVARVIDDLGTLARRAQALNPAGTLGAAPHLTPEQKRQAARAIKSVAVEIYTGAQDRILRRAVVRADVKDPSSGDGGRLALDLSFTKVGEDQDIQAPKNAKSFEDLLKVTGALNGALGNLGALGGGAGATPGATSGADPSGAVEKYAHCIVQAGNDRAKARRCADLLDG
jgi:hypothetical protein